MVGSRGRAGRWDRGARERELSESRMAECHVGSAAGRKEIRKRKKEKSNTGELKLRRDPRPRA